MALEIFKLMGSIFVDNTAANDSIAKTDKKAQGAGKTFLSGVGKAAKWGAGIATAASGAVIAVAGLTAKLAENASAIDDSSQRAGVTAEEFQKYAYAAKLSGMETSTLEQAMIKQQKAFADAKNGSKTLSDAYSSLGLDINNIGSSGDAFDQVISKLAGMEDVTKRDAIANDIFGKSYAALNPLFNAGADGIAQMKQEAVDMGAVMSNDAVAAGAQLGDTFDKIKAAAGGLFNSLAPTLLPILQQLADIIIANMPTIQSIFQTVGPIITDVFAKLLPPVMELVQNLLPPLMTLLQTIIPPLTQIITAILPIFTELLNMLLPPIIQIVQTLLPPLLSIIMALMPVLQTVIDLLKPILDLFMQLLQPILDLITTAIAPLAVMLAGLINTVLKPIIPIIKELGKIIGSVLGAAFKAIQPVIDNVMGYFKGLIDFITGIFTGDWQKAFQGLSDIFKNIFDGLINIAKAPINFIIKGINAFIKGLNKLKIPDWVPVVGGKGIDIPEIPELAKGGEIVSSGRVMVGEKGPEYLDLPKGAKITPLDKAKEAVKEIALNLTLNIENFNNNSEADIEKLADDLAFLTKRKLEGGGQYALA